VNHARLQLLFARAYQDLAAAQSAALVAIGSRLGLYEALAQAPRTLPELASATGVDERSLAPWLANQAASAFITKEPASGRYLLDEEQSEIFARPGSPHALAAGFALASELGRYVHEVEAAMRDGSGLPAATWDDRVHAAIAALDPDKGARVLGWLSADSKSVLESGGTALEIGCGDGALLLALAAAFPRSRFVGLDANPKSIERARAVERADDRVRYVVGEAIDLPSESWNLVFAVETLHEVSEPKAVARAVLATLVPGGALLICEPLSSGPDDPTPSTRLMSSLELQFCLPASLARGGAGLGPLAPPEAYVAILHDAGFSRIRRIEDPGRLVLEAIR
jgi:SAM-dependent methyltransferase